MSAPAKPGQEVFDETDLEPRDDDKRALRKMRIDKAAAIVAVIALGMWMGGLIALGACAAPMVFEHAPYPWSGRAMGATFARFDNIAIGCAVVALGCEMLRTALYLRGASKHLILSRVRRYAAVLLALGALYSGTYLTPGIMVLHNQGVRRKVGADGLELERLHSQAELIGKIVVPLAAALMVLHMVTLRGREDDDEEAQAPLPPGPRRPQASTTRPTGARRPKANT